MAAHSAKLRVEKPTSEKTSSTDAAMKRALLDKYSEVYDEVEDAGGLQCDNKTVKSVAPATLGLFQNANMKAVSDTERQKREKQKEEHLKKKEKDKVHFGGSGLQVGLGKTESLSASDSSIRL